MLEQFGQPIPGDRQARPLLVTEGSAEDKLRAIDGNDYLRHALGRLRETGSSPLALPLVVFGSRLPAEDGHIVNVLNDNRDRPIQIAGG